MQHSEQVSQRPLSGESHVGACVMADAYRIATAVATTPPPPKQLMNAAAERVSAIRPLEQAVPALGPPQ